MSICLAVCLLVYKLASHLIFAVLPICTFEPLHLCTLYLCTFAPVHLCTFAPLHLAPLHLCSFAPWHSGGGDGWWLEYATGFASFRHRFWILTVLSSWQLVYDIKQTIMSVSNIEFWILTVLGCCQLVYDIEQTVCDIVLWILIVFWGCHQIYEGHTKLIKYYQDIT